MITHLSEIIKSHANELLSRQDVKTMVDKLKETNPAIVEDTVPNVVSIAYLQKVLGNLLREGVPIRDLQTILETLSDYSSSLKDMDITTEYVRQALKRTITRRFNDAGQIRVITLDAGVENKIVGAVKKSEQGSYLALDPETIQAIVQSLQMQLDKVRDVIPTPIVLTSPIVRVYFKKLIDQFIPNVIVLSFNEIDNSVQIQAVGNISI
jgi:flagellar biosynthesis protein FlhA